MVFHKREDWITSKRGTQNDNRQAEGLTPRTWGPHRISFVGVGVPPVRRCFRELQVRREPPGICPRAAVAEGLPWPKVCSSR